MFLIMKKKICFVVASPFTAQVFLRNHISFLSKKFEITLIANFEGFDTAAFDDYPLKEIKDIPISRNISGLKDLRSLFLLLTYFNQAKFDAIHTVTPKAGLLGVFAARLANVKIRIHIFTGQVWHTKAGLFKQLLMFFDRFIVWNSTHILVDGESQRQFLIQNRIVKDCNSIVFGKGSICGVETGRFVPSDKIKKEVRAELGITSDEIVYMFLGRMNRDKGILELAEAFTRLLSVHTNVRLLFVGKDEENMTKLIKSSIIDINKVIFYGHTSASERLLQACDVFCLPSHREGFGTSIIEASLLEKPVICSDTYGLKETIVDNKTGIRHKVNNVESISEAMEILFNDESLRLKYGRDGRNYVLKYFKAEQITNEWIDFYKNILDVSKSN
jgi:glycosyltransferase involved in cell wall biosynthesis